MPQGVVAPLQLKAVPMMRLPSPSLLSGKTSNLVALHGMAGAEARGRLMTLETQDDRTLWLATSQWSQESHTGQNKKAAKAVRTWAKAKGLR